MDLYTASTKGNYSDLKKLLRPPNSFSMTEEISKSGFYWTIFHYAAHYGHYELLVFLTELLADHPDKYSILNL